MIATEAITEGELFGNVRVTKKVRADSTCSTEDANPVVRNLELEGVKELFQDYDLRNGADAVKCVVCGKSYKSKVCVKKHLWEHSVYWDLFDGLKKQQRVLSIQAAIILAIKFNPSLSLLLVTQSSNNNKKKSEKSDKSGDKLYDNNNQRKRKLDSDDLSEKSDSFIPRKVPLIIPRPTTNMSSNYIMSASNQL